MILIAVTHPVYLSSRCDCGEAILVFLTMTVKFVIEIIYL